MDELMMLAKQSISIVATSTIKDDEIGMWISAGIADLKRQDIEPDTTNALVKSAIIMFVKANFGNVDIKEKERSQETYNLLCKSLGLSEDYKVVDSDA